MKMSPVQLMEATILKMYVEPNLDVELEVSDKDFEFEDIDFDVAKGIGSADEFWADTTHDFGEIEARSVRLTLGIRTATPVNSPYHFEIVCGGVFAILDPEYRGPVPNDCLLWQSGLSILFGRIRELLSSTTLKMPSGELLLPTMSFMDDLPPANWREGPNEALGSEDRPRLDSSSELAD